MVVNLMTNLDRGRFDTGVIDLGHSDGWVLEQRLAKEKFQNWHLGKRPGLDLRILDRVRAVVRQFRPHVVHSHLCLHYVFPSLIGCQPPVHVVTVHLPAETHYKLVMRWLARMAYRGGVIPVAVSRDVADWLVGAYGVQNCMVIPNGIPIADYQRPAKLRRLWRTEQGYQEEDVLFVCAARLEKQKNQAMLLEAFAKGPATSRRAHLLLAGDGGQRPALEEQARELGLQGSVHFLGLRTDVCEIFAAGDVFVLPSHTEGNPLSLMEAMAAGLPVVATAVGGVPELVADQRSGLLVRPGDCVGLAAAMLFLLENPEMRRTMAAWAAQIAIRDFSASRMARRYAELYERMVASKAPPVDRRAEMATSYPI
jgi:glycosyltransferase involved in cell wall biosynthesis